MTIPTIERTAVFSLETLQQALALKRTTISRELRLGRLRYAKRGGRVLILGSWVLEWLQAGEVVRKKTAVTEN